MKVVTFSLLILVAGAAVTQADTLTIENGVPNYLSLVDDAALRAEGTSDGVNPWAEGNIGNATGYGSHRMYPDVGAWSGRGPRRYLTRFDLSSIPAGSIINSATMGLWFQRGNSSAEAISDYKLSRLQPGKAWSEGAGQAPANDGSVTWNRQIGYAVGNTARVAWATPGATGAADIDLATTITFNKAGPGISEWKHFDISSWVQGWVNGSWQNNGTVLWGGVGTGTVDAYYGIVGSEDTTNSTKPMLIVDYTVPEPTTLLLLVGGLAIARRRPTP